MDTKHLETVENLRNDLVDFCKKHVPISFAEAEKGTRFEYTNEFINFIVEKSFKQANNIREFPAIMQELITDRKHDLVIGSGKASDVIVEGKFAEHALCLDFDPKRGTLLKYNNRTLVKQIETECVTDAISNIRNLKKTTSAKLKNN